MSLGIIIYRCKYLAHDLKFFMLQWSKIVNWPSLSLVLYEIKSSIINFLHKLPFHLYAINIHTCVRARASVNISYQMHHISTLKTIDCHNFTGLTKTIVLFDYMFWYCIPFPGLGLFQKNVSLPLDSLKWYGYQHPHLLSNHNGHLTKYYYF